MADKFRYENHMALVNDTVGKIVIARDREDDEAIGLIRLFGNLVESQTSMKGLLENEIGTYIANLDFDRAVGPHNMIKVNGSTVNSIIGGAEFAFINGTLYLTGKSGEFGGLYEEVVKRCVGDNIKFKSIGLMEPPQFENWKMWLEYG